MGSAVTSTPGVASPPAPRQVARRPERRCNPRLEADDLTAISPRFKGRVLDVSYTGLRFSTTTRLKPDEQVSFHLIGEHRSIASALVRWCRLESVVEGTNGEVLSLYQVGLALLHEPRRLPPAAVVS